MSYKRFRLFKAFIVIVAGVLATWAAANGNPWIPVPAVIAAIIILLVFRRGIMEIIVDERTYSVAYKASRLAFVIFSVGAVTIGATLLAFGKGDYPELKPIGFTLTYSVCGLVLIYSIAYIIYNRILGGRE